MKNQQTIAGEQRANPRFIFPNDPGYRREYVKQWLMLWLWWNPISWCLPIDWLIYLPRDGRRCRLIAYVYGKCWFLTVKGPDGELMESRTK